jgi:hypothetical protein
MEEIHLPDLKIYNTKAKGKEDILIELGKAHSAIENANAIGGASRILNASDSKLLDTIMIKIAKFGGKVRNKKT